MNYQILLILAMTTTSVQNTGLRALQTGKGQDLEVKTIGFEYLEWAEKALAALTKTDFGPHISATIIPLW